MIMDVSVKSPISPMESAGLKEAAVRRQPGPASGSQADTVAVTTSPASAPTQKEVRQAVDKVRKAVEAQAPNQLSFTVDQDSGRMVVRIIDQKTGTTIRQIPSEEMLDIAKSIEKMQGILLKQSA